MDKKHQFKEFKPTSWSIDNKISIYVLAVIIAIFGLINYNTIPKEKFPEIVIPTFIVNTPYPGTSPTDMENLVTRPIEKNLKSINGVKSIKSNSIQDFSTIVVEFQTGIEVEFAQQKVKDAVDKTKSDLPNDLPADPDVREIDFSEFPIMYLNVSGDYDIDQLRKYGEDLQDKIESFKEITRVDLVGILDREIQIDVDMYKMQAAGVTLGDVERAVASENVTISGGSIDVYGMRRSINVKGELRSIEPLKNITMHSSSGAVIKLSDVADIRDSFKEQESYARLNGQNVVTLNVIKKSGQNLLDASDKIKEAIAELQKEKFPSDLTISITGDQSRYTRNTLNDLNNTIIIGFILVTVVLMFFMGLTNAIFVGLSVPLSMALAYIVMPGIDFTMNMLVMFSFIFALGIVVDDAIVVVENTHRIFMKDKKMSIKQAAKIAAGEVFVPILSGTLTTLAPFFPLAFWPGVTGKFMYFIPVTLIITLFASLIVAYIINPVFAVDFMKRDEDVERQLSRKKIFTRGGYMGGIAAICYLMSWIGLGNFMVFIALSFIAHNLWGYKAVAHFQHYMLPKTMGEYEKLLHWTLKGRRPYWLLGGLVVMLFFSFVLVGIVKPKVNFFPDGDPNSILVYVKSPVGTDVKVTDSITRVVEQKVLDAVGRDNPDIESMQSNVALGASDELFDSGIKVSHRGKITVNFVEYNLRKVGKTSPYLEKIRQAVADVPGVEIFVEKNKSGPPTGKPVNIELSSENLEELVTTSNAYIRYLDSLKIAGVEEFKSDFESQKPEIIIDIDRERANREGISTGQIGMEIRTAVLGKEISKFRDGEDQYPIQLRYNESQRENIDRLMNLKITYRDMNTGLLRQIPLASVARIGYNNSYGGIRRVNLKRVITVTTNVLEGYTANEVVMQVKEATKKFQKSDGIDIAFTGEQEDQSETTGFLGKAMLMSLFLILFILITQFNSITKPLIIIVEVVFSIIGVLLGFIIFDMTFSIIMTGLGLVALAGIVVRNGILLVEFTEVLREKGVRTRAAIVEAGRTRITPVLLTATSTVLGMIPLAIGLNINFVSLFSTLNPHIHMGGDSATFFGALAWTIIFGLIFATLLTLVFIPIMYLIVHSWEIKWKRFRHRMKLRNS